MEGWKKEEREGWRDGGREEGCTVQKPGRAASLREEIWDCFPTTDFQNVTIF